MVTSTEPSVSCTNSSDAMANDSPGSSTSLKRKRPPMIEIPNVLQEIQTDRLQDRLQHSNAICFEGVGVGVFSLKGKKKFMEDTHKIVTCMQGNSNKVIFFSPLFELNWVSFFWDVLVMWIIGNINVQSFFGVYDGHGGKKAAEFVAENLHKNILEMMENCMEKEEAVRAGFLRTDQDFLKQVVSNFAVRFPK